MRCQGDDGQFQLPIEYALIGLFRIQKAHVHAHLWVGHGEGLEQWRQPVQAHMVAGRHRQAAFYLAGQIAQRTPGVIVHHQDGAGPRQQDVAGLRQGDAPSDAIEQPCAMQLLQLGNALGNGRLVMVQLLGGQREGRRFRRRRRRPAERVCPCGPAIL